MIARSLTSLLAVILLWPCIDPARAQETRTAVDYLEAAGEPVEIDHAELEALQDLLEEPIDLNTATLEDLERIPTIDRRTASILLEKREQDGPFRTWKSVENALGAEAHLVQALRPFVRLRPLSGKKRRAGPTAYVATQVYWRSETDAALRTGVSEQHVEERRMTTRISVHGVRGMGGRLTISRGGAQVNPQLGGVKLGVARGRFEVVGGAYSARFGSGLVFSGGGIRDAWRFANGAAVVREASVTPRSSVSRDDHLSGVVVRFAPDDGVHATALYSNRAVDDGRESLVGFAAEMIGTRTSAGILVVRSRFSQSPVSGPALHTLRRFTGNEWRAVSVYLDRRGGAHRFGLEAALADPGAVAVIAALRTSAGAATQVMMLARGVASRFPLLHGAPTGVGACDGCGETGLLVAVGSVAAGWDVRAVVDAAARPWSSSASTWPGTLWSMHAQFAREIVGIDVTFRLSHARAPADDAHLVTRRKLPPAGWSGRTAFRMQTDVPLGNRLQIRVRFEAIRTGGPASSRERGILVYQQVQWRPLRALLIEVRDASFSARSSDARLYVHETDVLYQPVLSTLSGDGFRRYLRMRLDLGPHVVIEAKLGRLERTPPATSVEVSTSLQRRTDARVQLRLKT